MEELFTQIITELEALKVGSAFSQLEKSCIGEVIARLKMLKLQSSMIIETNAELVKRNPQLIEMREAFSDERMREILEDSAKSHPSIAEFLKSVGGKIVRGGYSEVGTYDLSSTEDKPDFDVIRKLSYETESAYNALWLIKERLSTISRFKNFNPKGVSAVRNHLMTHTKGANSGAHIYSFAIGTNGPLMRPIKPAGMKAPTDSGFENNLKEFLLDCIKALTSSAS